MTPPVLNAHNSINMAPGIKIIGGVWKSSGYPLSLPTLNPIFSSPKVEIEIFF